MEGTEATSADDLGLEIVEDEQVVEQTDGDQPSGAESGAEPDAEGGDSADEAPQYTEAQQKHIDSLIGKKVFQAKERERKLEVELQNANRRVLELSGDQHQLGPRPEVPPVPDRFDPEWEAKFKAHMDARDAQADWDKKSEALNREIQSQRETQVRNQVKQLEAIEADFRKRGEALDISHAALDTATKNIGMFGIDPSLTLSMFQDEHGPEIIMHLGSNATDLERVSELARTSPIEAVLYVERTVKPKAVEAWGKKTTAAPEPHEEVRGGSTAKRQRGPRNGTFR